MKILTVHNRYKIRGGEDECREAEHRVLSERGHVVTAFVMDNHVITSANQWRVGLRASWNRQSYREVQEMIRTIRPDVVDLHNFFPLASPSVHWAAHGMGVPVVQTLHNYRLICADATLYRDGEICEECVRWSLPLPSILHGCYHDDRVHSAAVALMIATHRFARTWQHKVSLFVTVSNFAKRKFVESGFPESRIVVKPNFVFSPGSPGEGGDDFLYVGRLTPEKGIKTLLEAMGRTCKQIRLNIVGDGPLEVEVRAAAARDPRIQYLGALPLQAVLKLMGSSKCLVFPSEWYETFGRVIIEAFSQGTPVIAANLGAMAELVDNGRTGFHFRAGDAMDLARTIELVDESVPQLASMRSEVRREFELKYTAARIYEQMVSIYERAIANP